MITLALRLCVCLLFFLWSTDGHLRASDAVSIDDLAKVFPGAERLGPFEGTPPAAAIYQQGQVAGYVLSTLATVGSTGYSGKPLDVLVGVGLDGSVTGALLRQHNEPILVIGIAPQQLEAYVGSFTGTALRPHVESGVQAAVRPMPDAISGATVSSAVIRDSILRAAKAVARSRGLLGETVAAERLDRESFAPATWAALLADGSIVRRRFTRGDVDAALGREKGADAADQTFIDLYVGLITPPSVGENLLGKLAFTRLAADLGPDDQVLLIAADGGYSFKGTAFPRSGRFDRVQIVQGDRSIPLTTDGYINVERLRAEGAPEFREAGVFMVRAGNGFDPLKPWRLDLLAATGPADAVAPAVLPVSYVLPERYRLKADAAALAALAAQAASDRPLWQQNWIDRWARILVVVVLLTVLTACLFFQQWVVARPRLYYRGRNVFLAVTLVWLGWYAGGQLSVVNVLTFTHSLMTDFQWDFFLLEPVIFLLWSYAAMALLFWGRGVYCGWLCPFGALQELVHEAAQRLRVPQVHVPFALHERLWPIKYLLFLGLFAVSLNSTNLAFTGAEIEPFKTAISMKFMRNWPFVIYAAALIIASVFIERFFCRYLCPLGAALSIPARLRMFEWLKRRPQCGRECQVCFQHCPVQAIHPEGEINPNECIHCLQCQTLYSDDTVCPPLAARRKRRERRDALTAAKPAELT